MVKAVGAWPCRDCFREQSPSGRIYCRHHNVMQAWIRGAPVLIFNSRSEERAHEVLKAVRAAVRKVGATDELVAVDEGVAGPGHGPAPTRIAR